MTPGDSPTDRIVPRILYELCSGPMTPAVHLETQQALVKQFADILEFVLKFDEMKVSSRCTVFEVALEIPVNPI